ncbi:SpoIIE family protein phosphatase [Pelagicoccus sp. SDUM812003]|uniref:SpoIIE family protein phosphatase n=1 Tax=Pelagicoccus sp. SDUM812003 TaxID=3041267 RepID=UPI00280F588E|nr:SpoIIE family protein phosphatase [Pelagicoccus sp. SDUM812003]MDQ8204344.1 SpoIIE family protein phosphatase [Pelagicoccus sp. SDUM812003]
MPFFEQKDETRPVAFETWSSPRGGELLENSRVGSVMSERPQRIGHEMDVHAARIAARHIANDAKLVASDAAAYVTGVSELAMNTLVHGRGGRLIQRCVQLADGRLAAVAQADDKGPGISDIARALQDGFSTAGSLGGGLPGAERLFDGLVIDSAVGHGTRAWGIKVSQMPSLRSGDAFVHTERMIAPAKGQLESGDAVFVSIRAGVMQLAVVDGVGHGSKAKQAAGAAIAYLEENGWRDPASLTDGLHRALRHSVGAAMACFRLCVNGKEGVFFGVGNVRGRLLDERRERYFESSPGILGEPGSSLEVERFEVSGRGVALLYSDGIANRFSLASLCADPRKLPMVAARRIFDTHRVERDDSSLVIAW